MRRALTVLAFAALAAPAAASAHATLLSTSPRDGAVLARSPRAVRMTFDDSVRKGSGIAAVSNTTNLSVLGKPASVHGRVLTISLRAHLANGDYTVRWSIVSDDGHPERGVIAFAVGPGSPAPHAVLSAATPLGWAGIVFRTLYYFGILGAAGAVVFGLIARDVLGTRLRRPLSHLLFFTLLLAFLSASAIAHSASGGTRFALVLNTALVVALLAAAAAALAPMYPLLLRVAGLGAIALLVAQTLSGHALDRNQPRWLAAPADVAHIGSTAIWLGGLVAVLYVLPRAGATDAERTAVVRRFSSVALIAVAVLGASGLLRALTELRSVSQIWSTSYGWALIAKTALFVPLIGIGWLNRSVLIGVFVRLRRSMFVEVTVIAAVVVIVAILTQLRPGSDAPKASAASTAVAASRPAVLPPRTAVVAARELGSMAVAVGRTSSSTTVTLLGPDGLGASGRDVRVDGRGVVSCGSGCYRGQSEPGPLVVTLDGRALRFNVPPHAPAARSLLARVTRAYRGSHSIVFDESLRSNPANAEVTRFRLVAPNRLGYRTRGGPEAIVIDARRWDRDSSTAPWLPSQQTPLDVTQPYWSNPTNVHLIAPHTLTFLVRAIPAWFELTLDPQGHLPTRLAMTAAAHFMVDRYAGFDVPVDVSPPPSR